MKLELFETPIYKAISIIIDLIFLIDILVNFNTTIDKGEKVVYDRKVVARAYLRGRFTVDFLSAVPLDGIAKLLTAGKL